MKPLFLASAALLLFPVALATAQDFPSQPIHIIVSAGPGGSPDIFSRTLAHYLTERIGQPVLVENRQGGAGNPASEYVATSKPDGHTLLAVSSSLAFNDALFPGLPFNRDSFVPIIAAIGSQQVLAVHPDQPFETIDDLVAAAKASPGTISVASPSWGTTGQLGVLLLQDEADIELNPVVYRNATAAFPDVVAGHADAIFVTLSAALPFIRDGALRPLAVTTPERAPSLPDTPTFREQGYPGLVWEDWQGWAAPAGTPQAVIDKLNAEINAVIADPGANAQLVEQGFVPLGGTVAEAVALVDASDALWRPIIVRHNIKPE
ncbi:Tripartite-type tricarboxylate transporter, receptor component TctC [Devosia enhydra]|uniref:Tripartite-type tricarboxylate transporter, receptor component TctC n=1 Tax=Devosia enhydra TaxID=665118 RepID=A0A1K2HTG2_9HYPH|nr:tripartite tricarboxylate transporter substrate binding protein [Devosia enhydra]SFZ81429.1 Tripartite-type tricarboxylate transporter, receptor component TctC [Devosia enhydra]